MNHNVKIWPTFFGEVRHRLKKFEIRKDDRNYQVGDILRLCEYYPETDTYSGAVLVTIITHIFGRSREVPGLKSGYVVLSIDLIDFVIE